MARTTIPALQIRELGIQSLVVAPGALVIPFGVCDFTLGDQTPSTGKEILAFQNVAVGAKTVTIDGAPDAYGRDGAITTYSIPASGVIITGVLTQQAFRQSDGMIYINAETADVKVAVLRIP
jgi:hypothetical protein